MKTRTNKKACKQPLVTIVVRGCILNVSPSMAEELTRMERETIRKEWNSNTLSE